jgi:hypothetical protein
VFKHPRLSWLPFYMLVPLATVLLFLDDQGQMSDAWRTVILGATAILICALALSWVERHPRFIEGKRPHAQTYRVISYPWSVFQSTSFGKDNDGSSEDESAAARRDRQPPRPVSPGRQEEYFHVHRQ